MDYVKGMNFAPFAPRGVLGSKEAGQSLRRMAERTGTNFVILCPAAVQATAQSVDIDYRSDRTMGDGELRDMIALVHGMGLRCALKPTVNCKNGIWRAHINFFDEDVPCEPKWSEWFASYGEFQLHFAEIAEECGCEMFITGCEMVQTERRAKEWRALIADVKTVYSGPVSYNTDKYQEHNVSWWDAVDVISSSGYYPIDDWERQLDRIERVVEKFRKPFFFAECGCMSTKGSCNRPNDWSVRGPQDLEEQALWYRSMFEACAKRSWVGGFALWSWDADPGRTDRDGLGYGICGKPAEQAVKEFYGA
ncbi:MAG: 1,4-beta-xylanase [Roseburia sp.]|nr:1,4-beta-xylanase [Roseburia sp.]MCM1096560.1 1,4-beta-xylanase [Ruminococcus flavefaciens]